jgi:hypothetical protein
MSLRKNRSEFEKSGNPIAFREIFRIHSNYIKKIRHLSTFNRQDLETLGYRPITPKNLPDTALESATRRPNSCCDLPPARKRGATSKLAPTYQSNAHLVGRGEPGTLIGG